MTYKSVCLKVSYTHEEDVSTIRILDSFSLEEAITGKIFETQVEEAVKEMFLHPKDGTYNQLLFSVEYDTTEQLILGTMYIDSVPTPDSDLTDAQVSRRMNRERSEKEDMWAEVEADRNFTPDVG